MALDEEHQAALYSPTSDCGGYVSVPSIKLEAFPLAASRRETADFYKVLERPSL